MSVTHSLHNSTDIATALERTHWAQDVGLDALGTMARFCEGRHVDAGAFVFRQGDMQRFLCTLVAGQVEILKQNSGEQDRLLASFTAGKTFGEIALIDHEPRSASAKAVVSSELIVLTQEQFEELSSSHPRLAIRIMQGLARILAGRLRMTSGRLVDFI